MDTCSRLEEPGGVGWKEVNVGRLRTTTSGKRSIWWLQVAARSDRWPRNLAFATRVCGAIGAIGDIKETQFTAALSDFIRLGEERAAHGLDAQYGRFAPQALVDRIGIAREVRDRDRLLQGAQGGSPQGGGS